MHVDPVKLTADLVRCPSVTPNEGGAIRLLQDLLASSGFRCVRTDRNDIANLFARWDSPGRKKAMGFNGHTDVVPPGDRAAWSHDPFSGHVEDGILWGRGATDMKSGVAAFAAAAIEFVRQFPEAGSIVITITGNEEGLPTDGTLAILDWMERNDERMDVCIVGEPTSRETVGDMVKIGRRGSMSGLFVITGKQGHSAYPHLARNPVEATVDLCRRLSRAKLDHGTENFDPSTLVVTSIDTGNPATNVIPSSCSASINIRFNDLHESSSLIDWLSCEAELTADKHDVRVQLETVVSGESFLTPPGPLSDLVSAAIQRECGRVPILSTSGGTSDARFIRRHCPVVELGLPGKTMHQTDEHIRVDDIRELARTYLRVLHEYFR